MNVRGWVALAGRGSDDLRMKDDTRIVSEVLEIAADTTSPREHGSIIDWKPLLYWGCALFALFVLGPIAGSLMGGLHGLDGRSAVTPLTSSSMAMGMLKAVAVLAIAAAAGLLGSRLFHARDGLTFAGLVVAWAAYRTGAPDELIRHTQAPSLLWRLSAEGLILGLLGVVLCVFVVSAHRHQGSEAQSNRGRAERDGESMSAMLTSIGAAAGAGAIVGGVVAWLIAVETLKLQTIAATACAGIAAGSAAQLVISAMPGAAASYRRTLVAGACSMAILATVGPVSALAANGSTGVLRAVYTGNYFGLAAPLALDWVAGALLGLPLGLSWSGSMIEKRQA